LIVEANVAVAISGVNFHGLVLEALLYREVIWLIQTCAWHIARTSKHKGYQTVELVAIYGIHKNHSKLETF
jgi:hypothetical protein